MGIAIQRDLGLLERHGVLVVDVAVGYASKVLKTGKGLGGHTIPRGSRVGVVRVWAFIRTLATIPWTLAMGSFVPEYLEVAWLMSSIVCHVVRPSSFLVC